MKAIYFNQSFNPRLFPAQSTALTFDENNGLNVYDNGKIINIPTATDKQQTDVILALSSQIVELEKNLAKSNPSGIYETETSLTVTKLPPTLNNFDKDIKVYDVSTEVANAISGNFVTVNKMKITANGNRPCLSIDSKESATVSNISTFGAFGDNSNQIDISDAKNISITDTVISASGYNGLMLGQSNTLTNPPEEIIIENVDISGEITLASMSICSTTDNANVIIRNCNFGTAECPLRFRNATNAKHVNILIENCHFEDFMRILFEENGRVTPPSGAATLVWSIAKQIAGEAGVTLLKKGDVIDGVTLEADETGGTPSYVKRVFPYLLAYEDKENRFGKDKMTITFRNCTVGKDRTKLIYTQDELKNIVGVPFEDGGLINILRQSGRESFNAWNENWPRVEGKEIDFFFPYDNTVKYIGEYIEEIKWTQTNKNSDCYPTIIFE